MAHLNAELITVDQAWSMLKDKKSQQHKRFPNLVMQGKYILADYKLTKKREAFKIRRHTFLKRQIKSYVAFDSDNGQTLWLHNFASLSEALFWLDTGLKTNDSDSHTSYRQWKDQHLTDINEMKDKLRKISHHRKIKTTKKRKKHKKK